MYDELYSVEEAKQRLEKYKPSVCDCKWCRDSCKNRPCWPTPEEALKIIDAGYTKYLMCDFWDDPEGDTYIIGPAFKGCEGRIPSWSKFTGCCALLSDDGLCKLHSKDLKPLEGRLVSHTNSNKDVHKLIASLWKSEIGKSVVERWRDETAKQHSR